MGEDVIDGKAFTTGETDLGVLLRDMRPRLNDGDYVFCTLDANSGSCPVEPLAWFQEKEGITIVLSKAQADRCGLSYAFICAWITLEVHSSLEAVGLTAAVSQALTRAGISCNMIAAYYHDHLFVPIRDADHAMQILQDLARFHDNTL